MSTQYSRRSNSGAPIRREPLTQVDYDKLMAEYIDRDTADRALLARLASPEGKELVGAKGPGNYAGIEFPNIWPGTLAVRGQRLRRDEPDLEIEQDETGQTRSKEVRKYLTAPGSMNLLYLFPETPPELLQDISVPITLTEGEKKVLALWRLANYNSLSPRFVPIGIYGVWSWRGKITTITDANGRRRQVKGPIPDLGRIPWAGREVYICFDSDVAIIEELQWARSALSQELRRRGVKRVLYITIPTI
jgi:hypothetical protein